MPVRTVAAALPILVALAGSTAAAHGDVRLEYIGRYDTHDGYHDHLMSVEPVGDHYALVGSNLDIVVVDLDALPAGGTQTYLDRLHGLDVTNTVTRPDGYVYANLRMGGLAVVHFDEATTSLSLIRTVAEPGVYYEQMTLAGDRLYVPAHADGLRVFDLADPANPVLLASLPEGFDDAFAVAVDGGLAYVADGAGGLKIVDVSDPGAPFVVAGESPSSSAGTAEAVLVVDGRVYVACGDAGVAMYEPGDLAGRVLFDTPVFARQLATVGPYLAVADGGGVQLFDIAADGSLTPAAGEYGQRRYAGNGDVTLRIWYDVAAWGDDRVLVANWDSMDLYQLVDPAAGDQPDVTALTARLRFSPAGGTKTVRITNTGAGVLELRDITASVPTFACTPRSALLPPGEQLDVLVDYAGGQPGSGLLLIDSNDPDETLLPIEVFGDTEFLDPGEPAIPFTLESWTFDHDNEVFEHGTFDLASCAGKVVFFQVFGLGCPACLPAIADIQNTIVGRYERDPRVVTTIVSQFDPAPLLEEFWSNVYLRGTMLYDPTSVVGYELYQQPYGGVPFSGGWIIAPDQTVVLPQFGYPPQLLIDTIDGLLADMPLPADIDGDGAVGIGDLLELLAAWGPCPGACPPACPGDIDNDCAVGIGDLLALLAAWG